MYVNGKKGKLPSDRLAGTFNPNRGSQSLSACQPCPPGQSCATDGLTAPTTACAAGYFCRNGTVLPREVCPVGFRCPAGSAVPQACGAGTFQYEAGRAACAPCPAGFYCELHDTCNATNSTLPQPCPPGRAAFRRSNEINEFTVQYLFLTFGLEERT